VKAFATDHSFDRRCGLEVLECRDDHARGRVVVTDDLKALNGYVHGGIYAAIAESLASQATGIALAEGSGVPVGLANHMSVLHPIAEGTIDALVIRRHRGRTTWVWQVEISDGQGKLCAIGRVTLAIRNAAAHRGAPRPSQ
jgi:1,4-dihydroxy-2-naphthoyl-CoA hydrolase